MDRIGDLRRGRRPRRAVLASMAAALGAGIAGGCTGSPTSTPGTSGLTDAPTGGALPVSRKVRFAATGRPLAMQVLAHPDDDLFFMNPDTVGTLQCGVPVVSVYVTGGGSFGVNQVPGQPQPRPDIPAYVSSRQQGLRQGYARMLGADVFTPWVRTTLALPGGGHAEVDTLHYRGRSAHLVFLAIDMHNKVPHGYVGLADLWDRRGTVVHTVALNDSPVRGERTYSAQRLTDSLAFLFRTYRPTLIRTLDPDPDIQVHDKHHPRSSDQRGYSDHPDHTAAALFTWAAMAQWVRGSIERDGEAPAFLTDTYRGYYNQRWPFNLPPALVRLKAGYLDAYGGSPAWACGNAAGCGDYSIGQGSTLKSRRGWVRSTHHRYPTAGPLASAGSDGALVVHAVLGTRAVRWVESAAGSGRWGEPEDLGGGPLAPALSAATTRDGQALLFGLRFGGLEGTVRGNTRDIVMLAEPPRSSGALAGHAWRSLGNPESDPVRGRRVGPPTVITGVDGRVHLFVRNASKGLSSRVRDTAGNWSGWRLLSGGQVQEGLTAALDASGCVHVFAAGPSSVHHWGQDTPTGEVRPVRTWSASPPGGAPDAVAAQDGSLLLAYHVPQSAALVVERLSGGPAGRWTPAYRVNDAGFGDVSLLAGQPLGGTPVLAVRTGPATMGLAGLGHGHHDLAPTVAVGRPAVIGIGSGTVALVTLGPGGAPRVTRWTGASRA
ncbi:PIG-L family deacetylase [Streptomyces sp. NPDC051976]|uniref:PIG-L family deacetylase n=1 Tax=Streptomyces sp. NPDC051976 TaxID=3154947 RepID=UPI0034257AE9